MAASFSDSQKAEEGFHKLNQIKDNNVFKLLEKLLEEQNFTTGQAIKVCCLLFHLRSCSDFTFKIFYISHLLKCCLKIMYACSLKISLYLKFDG